ncbi:MAG: thioredoxin family protein [Nonlabens sp.]|uniref:thioredoxin family protein n=2 Tax=Nonlabens sp. TaxID=1888209 RepID=UPI00321A6244
MNKVFLILSLFFLSINSMNAQEWITDFSKAKNIAKEENKVIILVFQGSDWCAPCIKLDKEVWSTDIFKQHATENYVMLQADFPRKRKNGLSKEQSKANALLADKYNPQGFFPFVVVLDTTGKVLGKESYKKVGAEGFIKIIDGFKG